MSNNPFQDIYAPQSQNPFQDIYQTPQRTDHLGSSLAAFGSGLVGSVGSTVSGLGWLTGSDTLDRGADWLGDRAQGLMDYVPDDLQDNYWYRNVAPGLGSLASYIGPGLLARGGVRAATGLAGGAQAARGTVSRAEQLAGFGAAGSMAAPAGIDEQLQRVRHYIAENPELGLTEEDFSGRIALGSIGGLVQIANLGRFIDPIIPREARGVVLRDAFRRAAEGGVSEAIVESGGNIIQNVLERSYNVDRGFLEDTIERGGTGGVVGFLGALAMSPFTGRGPRARITEDDVKKRIRAGESPQAVFNSVLENVDPARLDEATRRGEFQLDTGLLDQTEGWARQVGLTEFQGEGIDTGLGRTGLPSPPRPGPLDFGGAQEQLGAAFSEGELVGGALFERARPMLEREQAFTQREREQTAERDRLYGRTFDTAEQRAERQRRAEELEAQYQREFQPDPPWVPRDRARAEDPLPSNPALRIAFERARAGQPQTHFEAGVAAAEQLAPDSPQMDLAPRAATTDAEMADRLEQHIEATRPREAHEAVGTEALPEIQRNQSGQEAWRDARLKREEFRQGLLAMSRALKRGGGSMGRYNTNEGDRPAAPGDVIGVPSENPRWFQGIAAEQGATVEQVQKAVEKALAGRRLGEREARVIESMLETISFERMGGSTEQGFGPDSWQERLAEARELRRQARGQPTDAEVDAEAAAQEAWRDEVAGMRYAEDVYAQTMDAEARVLYEMAEDARAVDEAATMQALERDQSDAELARELTDIERGRHDTRREATEGADQADTPAQPRQDFALEGQRAEPEQQAAQEPSQPDLMPDAPTEGQQQVERRRQATERRLSGEQTVAPIEGEGELFAGERPAQADLAGRVDQGRKTDEQLYDEFDQPKPRGGKQFRRDAPHLDWIRSKRERSTELGRVESSGAYRSMGTVSGYFTEEGGWGDRTLRLSVEKLAALPGLRAEQQNVRRESLEAIKAIMGETGRLPLHDGREYAVFVNIDQDGRAWVNEGNHRIMAAAELGFESLPAEVVYFNGSEMLAQEGWTPQQLLDDNARLAATTETTETDQAQRRDEDPQFDAATAPPQPGESFVSEASESLTSAVRAYFQRKGEAFRGRYEQVAPDAEAGQTIDALEEYTGKRVILFRAVDGAYSPNGLVIPGDNNTIFINEAANRPLISVVGHEFTHLIQRDRPDLYARLKAEVIARAEGLDAYKARLMKAHPDGNLSLDALADEMVADTVGDYMLDPLFWEGMAEGSPDQARSLLRKLADFLNQAIEAFQNMGGTRAQQYLTDLEGLMPKVQQMLEQYRVEGADAAPVQADAPQFQTADVDAAEVDTQAIPRSVTVVQTQDQAPAIAGIPEDAGPLAMAYDPLSGQGYVVLDHAGEQAVELTAELAGRNDGLEQALGRVVRRRLERQHGEDLAGVFGDHAMASDPTVQAAIRQAKNHLADRHGMADVADEVAMSYLAGAADTTAQLKTLPEQAQRDIRRARKRVSMIERLRDCMVS